MTMGIELHSVKGIPGPWSVEGKPCDTCKSEAAAVFCTVESAFLCLNCDSRIHNSMNKHERVWLCDVCEQAPAAVTCKADAAALCVTCDSDIHSANPLARRHERHPVEPFFDSADSIVKSSGFNFLVPGDQNGGSEFTGAGHQDGVDSASWLIPNSKLGIETTAEMKSGDLFFMDPFIDLNDFEYPNSFQNHHSAGMDSVVPVQITKPELSPSPAPIPIPLSNNEICFDVDFCRSKLNSFSYQSQSVSSSSLDVGVVPERNSMSDISYAFGRNMSTGARTDPNGTVSGTGANQASQLCGIDREARVLRYREKRKNRKFEKTIRYHSRKAYAETRPRIKGRFAKRTDADSEIDRLYSSAASAADAYLAESQYGVVPTF